MKVFVIFVATANRNLCIKIRLISKLDRRKCSAFDQNQSAA